MFISVATGILKWYLFVVKDPYFSTIKNAYHSILTVNYYLLCQRTENEINNETSVLFLNTVSLQLPNVYFSGESRMSINYHLLNAHKWVWWHFILLVFLLPSVTLWKQYFSASCTWCTNVCSSGTLLLFPSLTNGCHDIKLWGLCLYLCSYDYAGINCNQKRNYYKHFTFGDRLFRIPMDPVALVSKQV